LPFLRIEPGGSGRFPIHQVVVFRRSHTIECVGPAGTRWLHRTIDAPLLYARNTILSLPLVVGIHNFTKSLQNAIVRYSATGNNHRNG